MRALKKRRSRAKLPRGNEVMREKWWNKQDKKRDMRIFKSMDKREKEKHHPPSHLDQKLAWLSRPLIPSIGSQTTYTYLPVQGLIRMDGLPMLRSKSEAAVKFCQTPGGKEKKIGEKPALRPSL